MRMDRLDLLAFGPFSGCSLSFAAGHEGLHVVFGENEAGKSSTLRALRDALFGIPARSTDNFLHRHQDLRIGFELRARDGRRFAAIRRKGNSRTLLDPVTEQPLSDDRLASFLPTVSRETFERMFGIDYQTLVAGGAEIASLRGDVGTTLFTAASGISQLRVVSQQLTEEAEAIFKSSGKNPPLNVALREYAALLKEARECRVASRGYAELRQQRDKLDQLLGEVERQRREAVGEWDRLQRLERACPYFRQRRQWREEIARCAASRPLRAGFDTEFRGVRQQLALVEQQIQELDERARQKRHQLDAIPRPINLQAWQQSLAALADELGSYRKAQADRRELEHQYRQGQAAAAALLGRLWPNASRTTQDVPRPTRQQRDELDRLTRSYASLLAERRQEERQRAENADKLRRARRDWEQSRPPTDLRELRQVVRDIQGQGPLELELQKAQKQLAQFRLNLTRELRQLGRWSGSLDELEALVLPRSTALREHERHLQTAQQTVDKAEEQEQNATAQLELITARLAEFQQVAGDLPTEQRVEELRVHRDHLWRAVRQAWHRGELTTAQLAELQLPAETDPQELASTFERAVAAADHAADRLRHEQQRVLERAQLIADQERGVAEQRRHAERLAKARATLVAADSAWQQLWTPLQITPGSPAEMQEWRTEAEQLRQQWNEFRQLEADVDQRERQVSAARHQLTAACALVGLASLSDDESLQQALKRCDDWLAEQEKSAATRQSLADRLSDLEHEAELLEQRRGELDEKWTSWQRSWLAALEPLAAGETPPEQLSSFLQDLDELLKQLDSTEGPGGLRDRLNGIDADASRFAQRVRDCGEALKITLPADPEAGARQLITLLQQNQDAHRQIATLEQDLAALADQHGQRREQHQLLQTQLRSLCEEAGVARPDELEASWSGWMQRRNLQERLEQVESNLHELARGQDLADLERELAGFSPADLSQRIAELKEKSERLANDAGQLREERGQLVSQLGQIDDGMQAIALNAKAQAQLARIDELANDYARRRLASVALRTALERFAEHHQDPLLGRASEYFAQLTENSFAGIKVDYDDDGRPVLVGRRPAGALVRLEGLSEGSADQLYLALRLAYLADWLERHEPLPLIVDDILIKFDDRRSRATLQLLAEFSHRTQVILFTHHQHLVELARDAVSPDVLFVQTLPPGS
ncbi:MAG: AAA family ATPase [Pirellulales bacterium]